MAAPSSSEVDFKQTLIASLTALLEALKKHKPEPEPEPEPDPPEEPYALLEAIEHRDRSKAKELLDSPHAKQYLSSVDARNATPLIWAAYRGYYDLMRQMLTEFGPHCRVDCIEGQAIYHHLLTYLDASGSKDKRLELTQLIVNLMSPGALETVLTKCRVLYSPIAPKMYEIIFAKENFKLSRTKIASIIARGHDSDCMSVLLNKWENAPQDEQEQEPAALSRKNIVSLLASCGNNLKRRDRKGILNALLQMWEHTSED